MTRSRLAGFVLTLALIAWSAAAAAGPALIRVDRRGDDDRALLLKAGVTLVMEREDAFLALGDGPATVGKLQTLGRDGIVVDDDTTGWTYFVIGLRPGARAADLGACGDPVLVEDSWAVVRTGGDVPVACAESTQWFVRRLDLRPLALPVPLPEPYASWQRSGAPAIDVHPVVQMIVDGLANTTIQSNWEAIINSATTRYSKSAGCLTATQMVFDKFQALGLNPVLQNHTTGHAPNVIGTVTGATHPEQVIIVIGHIDDMPSTGAAPGADDNASGAATVTSVAQAMAGYTYDKTVKFIAVTGEEQGLYGSEYYAAQAATAGEQIIAVLNADMTGWEGDGLPSAGENLDLNTNSTSNWLGQLMQEAAVAYGTGCAVDYFACPSMVYSDHAPFWDHGWSAVCGITDNEGYCGHSGGYPYYHTSNDTLAHCGVPAFFYGAVKAYLATAAHLAVPLCGGGAFPPVPTNVTAVGSGANRITLNWNSGGAGIEYEIFRGRGGCEAGDFSLVATTTAISWLDTNVSGGVTYAYRVRARRGDCVTDQSSCVTASTTGACQEYPQFTGAATVANAAQPICTLTVGWPAATPLCSGPVIYNVYRAEQESFVPGPSNRVASALESLVLADSDNLESATPVYYIVRAVDGGNGAEDQNLIVRTGTPTGPIATTTWSDDAGDTGVAALTPSSPWAVKTTEGHNGPRVYKSTATNNACGALTTPSLFIASGSQLTFWSKWFFDINNGDKGQVEISVDGGTSWTRLEMTYPTTSTKTGDSCSLPANKKYFTGINTNWTQSTATLSVFADMTIRLRFRISTDGAPTGETWWIDEIQVTNVQTPSACTPGVAGLVAADVSVDAASYEPGTSDGNGVLEPGEAVLLAPSWHNGSLAAIAATGAASNLTGPAGASYSLLDAAADYGTIAAGADGSSAADSYGMSVSDPASRPAMHWDVTFDEALSTGATKTWTVHVGRSFTDVPTSHWAYRFVETILHNGITSGCGAALYCPDTSLSRAEMAVLLLMAQHGSGWTPPLSTGGVFTDVPIDHWAGDFIEALASEGITGGCGGGNYCPDNPITRAEMAVFLIAAEHGSEWTPPLSTGGVFTDVPIDHWAGDFIEALAGEGITGGCGGGNFCPDSPVSRAEMAVFLTATFDLKLNQ